MSKKQRKKEFLEISKEVETLIHKFAHSLSEKVEGKVLLPPVIEYLMEKLGCPGNSEVNPLIIAGKDIEKVVIGYSSKTAANDRSRKVGPRYFMRGGRPYYLVQDLIEHFTQNPVETLNDERRYGNGNV
jgi:hypothetical protein